jgi:hypothetical protein
MPRFYKQAVSESVEFSGVSEESWLVNDCVSHSVSDLLRFSCELLLLEAGSGGQGYFGNPEESERSSLKPLPRNG